MTKLTTAPALLSVNDSAAYLSLCRTSVYKLVRLGKLPKPRRVMGRKVAFLKSDLDAYISITHGTALEGAQA